MVRQAKKIAVPMQTDNTKPRFCLLNESLHLHMTTEKEQKHLATRKKHLTTEKTQKYTNRNSSKHLATIFDTIETIGKIWQDLATRSPTFGNVWKQSHQNPGAGQLNPL
jgi:hypothetical protein